MFKLVVHVKTTGLNWLYEEFKVVPMVQVFTASLPITVSPISVSKEILLLQKRPNNIFNLRFYANVR